MLCWHVNRPSADPHARNEVVAAARPLLRPPLPASRRTTASQVSWSAIPPGLSGLRGARLLLLLGSVVHLTDANSPFPFVFIREHMLCELFQIQLLLFIRPLHKSCKDITKIVPLIHFFSASTLVSINALPIMICNCLNIWIRYNKMHYEASQQSRQKFYE